MRSMPQYAGRFTPPDIPMPPVEPEPWSFESWFADSVARRAAGNLFDELKSLDSTVTRESYLLTDGSSCDDNVGWDLAKLERDVAARRGPSASVAPAPTPAPTGVPVPADAPAPKRVKQAMWSAEEVDAMTVPKLKEALMELGLATTGLKAVLKARLTEALGF